MLFNFLLLPAHNLVSLWFTFCSSRFAQFFIKPLMSPDATMREIKAVDSGSIFLSHISPPPFGRLFPWTFCIFLSKSCLLFKKYFNLASLISGFLHLNNKKFQLLSRRSVFQKIFYFSQLFFIFDIQWVLINKLCDNVGLTFAGEQWQSSKGG